MRLKESSERKMEIQRVRKLNIANVYCIGCTKQSVEEIALGLSNGKVKLYNYKDSQFVQTFNADNIRNSVVFVDYNCSDDYLASVFENGQINLYGIMTKKKLSTINIDGNTTLARFHPSKRSHLSTASFKGAVSVFDLQTNRKIFHSTNSHAAQCRDLCMAADAPETLISVGYDCIINIYDLRRKLQSTRIQNSHPLSTVAISNCGIYFCIGNLKGELTSYDMRNTKTHLTTKKVHNYAVTRVGFVTNIDTNKSSSFIQMQNQTVGTTESSLGENFKQSIAEKMSSVVVDTNVTRSDRDSFGDFFDYQTNKVSEIPPKQTVRRDSFDWEALSRKPTVDDKRFSINAKGASLNATNSANNSGAGSAVDSFELAGIGPLRDRSNTPNVCFLNSEKLKQIDEEQPLSVSSLDASSSSEKENLPLEFELSRRLQVLSGDRNSTPNRTHQTPIDIATVEKTNIGKQNLPHAADCDLIEKLESLRLEMNSKFHQLENEIKFNAENNKWEIFTQSSNLWNKQLDTTEEIRDALGVLLQTDPFVQEFIRLKEENAMLKASLEKLNKQY